MNRFLLSLCLLSGASLLAQDPAGDREEVLPKPTKEGIAALQELTKRCIEGGALKFIPRTKAGPSRFVLTDGAKLKSILRDNKDLISQALCDTLLTTSRRFDQSVLLEAVAEFRDDNKLRAFAALARGESLRDQGNGPEAAKRLADAAKRLADLKLPTWQAQTLATWGALLNEQGQHLDALERFQEACKLVEKARGKVHADTAMCLVSIGDTEQLLNHQDAALQRYQDALRILHLIRPEPLDELSRVHRRTGSLLLRRKDANAIKHFQQAVELAERLSDPRQRIPTTALALADLGHAHLTLGQLDRALDTYQRARKILEEFHKKPHASTAAVIRELGNVHFERGDRDACIKHLEESLRMFLDLSGERSWNVVHGFKQLGAAHNRFEEPGPAQRNFERAREIAALLGGPKHPQVADSLAGLAEVALTKGDYWEALEFAKKEKMIRDEREAIDPLSLADSWNRLGTIYHRLGQDEPAVAAFRQALDLWTKAYGPSHLSVASGWQNLGTALAGLGLREQAAEAQKKALGIRETSNPRDEGEIAQSLNALGSLAYQAEDYTSALRYHLRAWEILKKQPRLGIQVRVFTLNNIGMSHFGLREWPKALEYFDLALEDLRVWPRAPKPDPESPQALYGFAPEDLLPILPTVQILHQRGMALMRNLPREPRAKDLMTVAYSYVAAIGVLEQVRGFMLESEEGRWEAGANFADLAALLVGVYDRSARLPGTNAQDRELREELAFRAAELGSARAFLRNLARARADVLAALPGALRDRYNTLTKQLREMDQHLAREQSRPALERDLEAIARLLATRRRVEADLVAWEKEVKRQVPRFFEIQSPTACTLQQARDCLRPDEVALLYVMGAAQSHVMVIEGGEKPAPLTIADLPKSGEIAEWIAAVRDQASLSSFRPRSLEAEGYRLLVAPIAERIKGKHLVIVPTGELWGLPFELLAESFDRRTGNVRYLIESHRVRYAPSMSFLHLQGEWTKKREQPDRLLWALGDPVFDPRDERIKGRRPLTPASAKALGEYSVKLKSSPPGGQLFPRLPASGREIEAIRSALEVTGDESYTGIAATEAAVKEASASGMLARHRYLHFATHGIPGLDVGRQPSLVLTLVADERKREAEDGFLQFDEILRLRLNADLVVLSACETGRGRLYRGEGVRGLSQGFLQAGSRGVVCSLWAVPDRETSDFMVALYKGLKRGQSASEALRDAKREMIHAGKPPLYWASFVLIGE